MSNTKRYAHFYVLIPYVVPTYGMITQVNAVTARAALSGNFTKVMANNHFRRAGPLAISGLLTAAIYYPRT